MGRTGGRHPSISFRAFAPGGSTALNKSKQDIFAMNLHVEGNSNVKKNSSSASKTTTDLTASGTVTSKNVKVTNLLSLPSILDKIKTDELTVDKIKDDIAESSAILCTDDVEEGMIGYLPRDSLVGVNKIPLAQDGTSFFVATLNTSGDLLWKAFPSS